MREELQKPSVEKEYPVLLLTGNDLTLEDVVQVAREGRKAALSPEALEKVKEVRRYVDKIVEEERTVYGITTGFGKFSDHVISQEDTKALQRNLIISHTCAMGNPLPQETVRAAMLLRANALAKGFSGVTPNTLQTLLDMLNQGVHPVIPEKGSLGASGDLAPLAMMVLVMIGEGEAFYQDQRISGREAMDKAGIPVVELVAKEGLSLINGTQIMTGIGALLLYDAIQMMKTADTTAALTMEALHGITDAFDPKVQAVRGQEGQARSARNILRLLGGSAFTTKQGQLRVQDAYTLRCIPQIHGASHDAINYVKGIVLREMNAATDNPLIFAREDEVISGGNFHGQPMALAMDFLGIALSELANVSERRLERLVNSNHSSLPAFLTPYGGLHSGFMITQYAAASMVSENKIYAHPASVDSIPSSMNQEDHVSMGTTAARKGRMILDNVEKVLGIEAMAAAQAISLQKKADEEEGCGLAPATAAVFQRIRRDVPVIHEDVVMHPLLVKMDQLVKEGALTAAAEEICGELEL